MTTLFLIIPLALLVALNFLTKGLRRGAFLASGILLSLCQIGAVILLPQEILNSPLHCFSQIFYFPLSVDNLSRLMLLCIGILIFIGFITANNLIKEGVRKSNFFSLLFILGLGMNGVVLVRDLFSLYVFLEITSVVSFILIAIQKERDAFEGAFKYIIFSAVASVLMLASIGLIMMTTGDVSFAAASGALMASPNSGFVLFAVAIFLSGLFIKAGLMPFHGWLADAYMSAPAPVSIVLAGIVTKTLGVYSLMRVVGSVFGFVSQIQSVLMFVGALSIVAGALAALGQNNFKRMLAYSSISQVGFIILSFGCGTELGVAAAMFHLFNHSIFKGLLFVNSAAVESQAGSSDMDDMSGLASRMPVTGVTSALACLSASGFPPLSGFWSKLLIVIALWMAGFYVYAILAVLSSVLTLGYMLMLQRRVFFGLLRPELEGVKEAGLGLIVPSVILAAIMVGVGLFFPYIVNTFLLPVATLGFK